MVYVQESEMKLAIAGLILICAASASAQTLVVKILDRQDSATGYTYFAPGFFNSQSTSNVNCYGDTSVRCSGSSTTNGTITAPRRISYEVRGATFTLLLPDGRGAVVNCESKYMPKFDYINRRSCRMPLVDNIHAEFHGDKAKLEWVVSLDGKKMQSETYKVIAVLDVPKNEQPEQKTPTQPLPTLPATAAPATDLFVWFDESAPSPGVPLFDVIVTSRAYEGAIAILRQTWLVNTSVRTGVNVLDTNYHPSTVSLKSWQKSNPKSLPWLFYWKGEEVNGTVSIMHFQMTKRAYQQMLALVAGSDLRIRP
jgi:hypothetical protein